MNRIIWITAIVACLLWGLTFSRAGAAEPKKPVGYFALRPAEGRIDLAKSLLASKHIAGFEIRDRWCNVEREPGKYDFSRLAAAAAQIRKAGKKYTLVILGGSSAPPWLFDKGCKYYQITPGPHDPSIFVPIEWDPVMIKHYTAMVAALGKEFDSDPACVKVNAGGPTEGSNEMFVREGGVSKMPNAAELLTGAWYDCLDAYGEAFPSTPISLNMAHPFSERDGILERVAKYHADTLGLQRAAFQYDGYNARPDAANYGPYKLVKSYGERGYMTGVEQVQPTSSSRYGGSGSRQQKFDYSVNRARDIGCDFFDFYEPDLPLIKKPFVPR